jgi:hypothetical protein
MSRIEPVLIGLGLCVLAGVASCGTVIISQPVQRDGDNWGFTLRKLTNGPGRFSQGGNTTYVPKDGQRFIWAHVTLHNRAGTPRKFNFDRCDLDAGDQAYVPSIVSFAVLNSDGEREPELAAGETIERRLIFPYPSDRSPTRLQCAPMVIPLPQF